MKKRINPQRVFRPSGRSSGVGMRRGLAKRRYRCKFRLFCSTGYQPVPAGARASCPCYGKSGGSFEAVAQRLRMLVIVAVKLGGDFESALEMSAAHFLVARFAHELAELDE